MTTLDGNVEEKIEDLLGDFQELMELAQDVVADISLQKFGDRHTWSSPSDARSEQLDFLKKYEEWYNSSYPLISDYLPDRANEFEDSYTEVRNLVEVNVGFLNKKDIHSEGNLTSRVSNSLLFQANLLNSIPDRVASEQLKAREQVSSNIVSEEVQRAKELFDEEHIRAAGVIGGVALERHLLTLCETSEQNLEFDYMDGISSLAETLNEGNEITDDDLRLLQYLGGVRNKCSHASDEDPERREVERMLNEVDEFIRK